MWKTGWVRKSEGPLQAAGQAIVREVVVVFEGPAAERGQDRLHGAGPGPFIDRDTDPVGPDGAQVDAVVDGVLQDHRLEGADIDRDRVEELLGVDGVAQALQPVGDPRGLAVNPLGDGTQAQGPVEDGIHAGDHRQQHLRRADVGRRLFAADVLLARLQRQPVGLVAARVYTETPTSRPGIARLCSSFVAI